MARAAHRDRSALVAVADGGANLVARARMDEAWIGSIAEVIDLTTLLIWL
jgi:uncharacterized protein GlcG (DUF336 family)